MNARVLHAVTGRLSLRPPQAESLTKLVRALDAAPAEFSADDAARLCAAMRDQFSGMPAISAMFGQMTAYWERVNADKT